MKNRLQFIVIVWIASAGISALGDCSSDLQTAQKACCADGDAKCQSTDISGLTDGAPTGSLGNSQEFVFVALRAASTTAAKAQACGHPAAQCIKSCAGAQDTASKHGHTLCMSFKKSSEDLQKQSDAYKAEAADGQKTADASSDKAAATPSMSPSSAGSGGSDTGDGKDSKDASSKSLTPSSDSSSSSGSGCGEGSPACASGKQPSQANANGEGNGSGGSHNASFLPSSESASASHASQLGGGPNSMGEGGAHSITPQSAQSQSAGGIPNSKGGGSLGEGSSTSPTASKSAGSSKDDKTKANVLSSEVRGGGPDAGGGAGGSGGGSSGNRAEDLSEYLPGGARAARSVAALDHASHPDIISTRSNIFESITKRFQILCTLQELRDCEK